MPKYTAEQIGKAAAQACFYVTPDDQWLRMQWTDLDEGKFCAADEDSGEDYVITFAELEGDDAPHFEELSRMEF